MCYISEAYPTGPFSSRSDRRSLCGTRGSLQGTDAPLSGQERPRITQGAILSKVMTSVTRIHDLGLLVLGLILVVGVIQLGARERRPAHVAARAWHRTAVRDAGP